MQKDLESRIFSVKPHNFDELALQMFNYQLQNNSIYKKYIDFLGVNPNLVQRVEDIPFLPISLFKSHKVYASAKPQEAIFSSSGTTGTETSKHHIASLSLYQKSFLEAFTNFYSHPSKYAVLALLPSYLERQGSSLVYMVNRLIEESGKTQSGFFLNNHIELYNRLAELNEQQQPTILFGVTFALLDFVSHFKLKLNHTTIIETGGMKGRRKEMIREEVHRILTEGFGVKSIHSEYGMTELLSQAYSSGEGIFKYPPWMRVFTRDPYDPLTILPNGQMGALNIIDLANIYSCPFIQTDDLGAVYSNNSFIVSGRMDGSQVRGCNLMVL
jgi:phenylacetate-coenzyme A ligase PaaK-like adenylate-forming protein